MKPRVTALFAGYARHRFAWLFATLLVTLPVAPLVSPLARVSPVELLLAANLFAAIASATRNRWFRALVALGCLSLAARALALFELPLLLRASEAFWLMTAILALAATARRALLDREVDSEHIFAALDAYLLVGLIFGVGYSMLDQVWPASFGSTSAFDLDVGSGIYFSFITLATLGYGDIVPLTGPARGLVIVEAVAGQMYIAVLVARLVSAYRR
jgi:hypothetical protein